MTDLPLKTAEQPAGLLSLPGLQHVLGLLNPQPDMTRIVGGAVRNTLLSLPIGDIDLATQLLPTQVMEICAGQGLRCIPTGLAFGTVTVVFEQRTFEVTTLREDIQSDGRHAVVSFGTSWERDAARRDFTINALYLSADGQVHAPIGGFEDLREGRVRFIGDARTRIREDYLRIWRFFRFSAIYAKGEFDSAGLEACLREKDGLAILSPERIHQELFKLLSAGRALEALQSMSDMGLALRVLGVLHLPRLSRFIEQHRAAGSLARLAALCLWQKETAEWLSGTLRLPRAQTAQLLAVAEIITCTLALPTEAQARQMLYRSPEAYETALRIVFAQGKTSDEAHFKKLLALPQRRPIPAFPVKGADIIKCGHQPGARLGEILKKLETAWVDSDFSLQRSDLLKKIPRHS